MLDITFDLIGEATSNSLLMFCFCNIIIVMILTGSTKSGSTDSQDSAFVTSVSFSVPNIASDDHDSCDDGDEEMTLGAVSSAKDELLIDDSSVSDEEEDRESINLCDNDDDVDDEEEEDESYEAEVEVEEEEEEDDELRKRVEEFIAKINNEWRHEKLRTLNLVY